MIEIINAGKTYKTKAEEKVALKNINLNFKNQGLVIITGESGSGKTTLMNCISGLDNFTEGSISGISRMDVAFVFQDYQLIEDLSIRDNLTIGMPVSNEEIHKVLLQVNLEDIDLNKKICHLSGGQKQRVSIARALLLNRRVIICDEPTGNLDKKTATQIVQVLSTISKEKLVIVVTHNRSIFVEYADEFIHLQDGMIQSIEGAGTRAYTSATNSATVVLEKGDFDFMETNKKIQRSLCYELYSFSYKLSCIYYEYPFYWQ